MQTRPILLSPPEICGGEHAALGRVLASGWLAPAGPELDLFEQEFCKATGNRNAVALSSGTAAIHLGLVLSGVERGDEVLCSTFTFAATANPIIYAGATPVFVDCDEESWNMGADCLEAAIQDRIAARGRPPKAAIVAHVYGQSADIDGLMEVCARHGVLLVEDAAEALGCIYHSRSVGDVVPGSVGVVGAYSFNGNKIVTTSGGGMLTSPDPELARRGRFLSSQARDAGPHYQHSQIGFNYRMSSLLAAVGRVQLQDLDRRVLARRAVFQAYVDGLCRSRGLGFMPEATWNRATRWLSCITIDPHEFGAGVEAVRSALAGESIESRPVWKPLHMQPSFAGCRVIGGAVAERLFATGLCLPSGAGLAAADIERVVATILGVQGRGQ